MSSVLDKPEKPLVVLILGGTTTVAKTLAKYLLDEEQNRAQFVRIGKTGIFSVNPPTTYLEKSFKALLEKPKPSLEYQQVNLSNVDRHVNVLNPPSTWNGEDTGWKRFDVVYDLTGDTSFDKPELIQISNTYQLASSVAKSAAALPANSKPLAYVRLTFPFYEMKSLSSSSLGHTETAELRPDGVRGRWWHETIVGLAQIKDLNTGVIRAGAWYGPGTCEGEVIPRTVVGQVYQYLKEEMKFLHNADLRINTVHSIDVAQALYLLSLYLMSNPRDKVMANTAVNIPFSFASPATSAFSLGSNKRSSISDSWKTVKTVVPEKETVLIPLFNVVDDNDSTQETLAKAVAQLWGIKYGFMNSTVASLVQQFAKAGFSDVVEDVNEMHVEAWGEMLEKSKPRIESTSISPYLEEHAFRKLAICFDATKAKKILGYKPIVPKVEVAELRRIVEEFQSDGLWPKLD